MQLSFSAKRCHALEARVLGLRRQIVRQIRSWALTSSLRESLRRMPQVTRSRILIHIAKNVRA